MPLVGVQLQCCAEVGAQMDAGTNVKVNREGCGTNNHIGM